jgi:CubicO group peptidase (beta-lactamase class C family)
MRRSLSVVAGMWLLGASLYAGPAVAQTPAICKSDLQTNATPDPINEMAVAKLQDAMAIRYIPGLQAAVVKNGRIVMLSSCGFADLTSDQPVQPNTRFQLASGTKAFIGVLIMQLVEEGKLRLDTPISDYLEDLPSSWRTVTVRQALTHASGLPDIVDPSNGSLIDPGGESASWAKVQTLPMQFVPGQGYAYNQTNYLILGRIIEKLQGKPFTEVMRERELIPAGMAAATYSDRSTSVPDLATNYTRLATATLCQPTDGCLKLIATLGVFGPGLA